MPGVIVYEDADTLAFLDINPVNIGHTLVIPKRHSIDIFEIDEAQWNNVMKTVRAVSHALEKSLKPTGINLAMNNRSGAGQVIFHAHVHVIPRFPKDGHELWRGTPYAKGEAAEIAGKIRAAL
ncbi:MAG: hypothetical protein RLZZ416_22 [Candidatus Parcubacteria bacterium]